MQTAGVPSLTGVHDVDDPRLAGYAGLTRGDHEREQRGLFVAEGKLVVRRVLEAGLPVESLLVLEERAAEVGEFAAGFEGPVLVAPRTVINTITGFNVHRGVLALVKRPAARDAREVLSTSSVVFVVEDINDGENLGSIFRAAAALGVDAVLLSPRTIDPLVRRVVRVSMGHVLSVPFATLAPWPDTLDTIVKRAGYALAAMTPKASTQLRALRDERIRGARIAVLLGAEGPGLTERARSCADLQVAIPMRDGIDSLNVAHAAAIAAYELGSVDVDVTDQV